MANAEYISARNMALRANEIANASSCREALCCEASVPLTRGDIGTIVKGIRSGKITDDIVSDAVARSQDPKHNEICPFLTPAQRCSIYKDRPLTCILWGIGGDPIDKKHYDQAVEASRQGGSNTYPNLLLVQSTCLSCRITTHADSTPIEANQLALEARSALRYKRKGGKEHTIIDFTREELPSIR